MSPPSRIPTLGPRGEGWVLLQFLVLGAAVVAGVLTGGNWAADVRPVTFVVGAFLIATGIVVAFLGIRHLGRSMSPMPRPMESAQLVQHGVYRRLRHPIYAALIAMTFGWVLVTASWIALGLGVVLFVVLDLKARREEVWLRERFPDYVSYSRRTRRFVPGLY